MPLPFPNSYLYLVAINEYDEDGIDNLQSPQHDVQEIENLLTAPPHGFVSRRPANTNHDGIIEMLERMPHEVQPKDRVLFYFAGHGLTIENENGHSEGYLLPKDARLGNLGKKWISMSTLLQYINQLPCIHSLIVLDCCFAGSILWADYNYRNVRRAPRKLFKEHYDFFVKEKAWQVLVSAAFDQTAKDVGWRGDSTTLSPFVEALLRGLRGKADFSTTDNPADGIITATELAFFLRQEIEIKARHQNIQHRQTPRLINLKKHDKGEYVFLNPVVTDIQLASAVEATKNNNPFKGLQTYSENDEQVFYGRERVVSAITDPFLQQDASARAPLLIVTGISGSGKSSVVRAGVVPALIRKGWQYLGAIRPGEAPLEELKPIRVPAAGRSFLVIDQLEELVTQNRNKANADKFMEQVYDLYNNHPQLGIIFTLRSDFENQVPHGPFIDNWNQLLYRIPWFNRQELRDTIVRPAANMAFFYQPLTLIDQIVDDVLQYPGSLPMLSVLLSELYLHSIRRIEKEGDSYKRLLNEEDYWKIGGVAGALQSKLNALSGDSRAEAYALRAILLRMVNLDGGIYTKKKTSRQQIDYPGKEKETTSAIELLEEERIITNVPGYAGTWEPVHDAVVRWEQLARWIETIGAERMAVHMELGNDIEVYLSNGSKSGDLWHNNERLDKLYHESTDGDNFSNTNRFPLNAVEKQFIENSQALKMKNKSRRRNEQMVAFSVLGILLITAVIFLVLSESNRKQAKVNAGEARLSRDTARLNEQKANQSANEAKLALYQYETERYNALVREGDELLNGGYRGNALQKYNEAKDIAGRNKDDDSVLNSHTTSVQLADKIRQCEK